MKLAIELEDFWMDEDSGDIEAELKEYVVREVAGKIQKSIREKVEEQITKKVQEIIEFKLGTIIDEKISQVIDSETIKPRRCNEIKIVDHVKNLFETHHGWGNADEKIKRIAKEFGEELKHQYNNAFANKIVQNMKEQGLLKDEVVQILLKSNP